MMNDARRLVMHEQRLRRLQEEEVEAARVVEVDVEVVLVVVILMAGNVLLGIMPRAPTPALS
jgi:hypothetical protein